MPNIRAQEKRTSILDAAAKLFLERGYDAVSLDDILEEVGGSKATLYSYYGGKEGLFAATVESACSCKLASLQEIDLAGLDPEAGLTLLGRKFLQAICDTHGKSLFRTMVAEAERFPQLATAFYQAGPEGVIRVLQRGVETWQAQGLIRPGNPEVLAIQFMGMLMGNFHVKSLLGLVDTLSPEQINEWVSNGVRLFLQGAGAKQNS